MMRTLSHSISEFQLRAEETRHRLKFDRRLISIRSSFSERNGKIGEKWNETLFLSLRRGIFSGRRNSGKDSNVRSELVPDVAKQ